MFLQNVLVHSVMLKTSAYRYLIKSFSAMTTTMSTTHATSRMLLENFCRNNGECLYINVDNVSDSNQKNPNWKCQIYRNTNTHTLLW